VQVGGGDEEREQRDERVHPRLLRVVRQEGVRRGQGGGDPARARAEHAAAGPERRGQGEHGEDDGQRVGLHLAVADQLHPAVQEQVVQRRRAVEAQDAGDVGQGVARDADAQALVDPEPASMARVRRTIATVSRPSSPAAAMTRGVASARARVRARATSGPTAAGPRRGRRPCAIALTRRT
jgi:hypothetical protein